MAAKWIEESERKGSCSRCHASWDVGTRFYWLRRGTYLCELCGSIAEHEEPEIGDTESGVLKELEQMPPEASDGALAKLMLGLARRIDTGDVADRDYGSLVKELRTMVIQIRDQYPAEPEDDETERTRKRREQRLLMGGELSE